ncbi:MAG: hypothetical protein ABI947_14380 [Chloroflexota bacterium]
MWNEAKVPIARVFLRETVTKGELIRLGEILAILLAKEAWITGVRGLDELLHGEWPSGEGKHVLQLAPVQGRAIDFNKRNAVGGFSLALDAQGRETFQNKLVDAIEAGYLSRITNEQGRQFDVHGQVDLDEYRRFAIITDCSGPAVILGNPKLVVFQQALNILRDAIPPDLGEVSGNQALAT